MSDLLSKVKRSTYYVVPAQIFISALGLVYSIVLARLLSVDLFGIYSLLISSLIVFSYLCNFGIASSLQRYVPEYASKKQFIRAYKLIYSAHVIRFVLSVLIFLIGVVSFYGWSPNFGLSGFRYEFILFAISAVFIFQIEYYQVGFSNLFMHAQLVVVQVLINIIKLAMVIVVFLYFNGLSAIFIVEITSYVLGFIVLTRLLMSRYREDIKTSKKDTLDKRELKRVGKYSLFNALIGPGAILYSNSIDYFIVAYYSNAYLLGIYALAYRASKMIFSVMPQVMLQNVIRPAFYHKYSASNNEYKSLEAMFKTLVSIIAAFILPIVIIVVINSENFIVFLFGEKYSDAVNIFIILLLFNISTIVELPCDLVLQAIEKPQTRLYAQIFSVYNIVLAIILFPVYGLYGVAFSTGSAVLLKSLLLMYYVKRYTGISVNYTNLYKITLNTIVSSIVAYLVYMIDEGYATMVASIFFASCIYVLMTVKNNFMSLQEKQIVNSLIKIKLFK